MLAVVLGTGTLAGCRTAPQRASAPATDAARPLSGYAARRVIVLPVQSVDDAVGWTSMQPDFRQATDDEIAFALRERGLGDQWILPAALATMTKRAGTFLPDVRKLTVEPLRRRTSLWDGPLPEPLAGQLRQLVAFTDARWVLLPVELRLERAGDAPRAVIHATLVDARGATMAWIGDVAGDTSSTPGPRTFASAAARLADLVTPAP